MPRRRWAGPLLLTLLLTAFALLPAAAPPSFAAAPATTADTAPVRTTADTAPVRTAAATRAAAVPLPSLSTTTTQVASGLRRPTAIAAPDDGTGRLFITEKSGTVRVYQPETGLSRTPLLDITSAVDESGNERGLLGIALPPDFADSQDLYLAYTALPDGAVTLARYRLDESRLEVLLAQEHAEYSNHNGGQLAFGRDGNLYWSIGDGGGSGDPFTSGQRLDTLLGKILRIDVSRACGPLPYCVPADNPFVDTPGAREEIWLYGLRNPWRFSFDQADGSLWIGDVGQGRWEEVDHLPSGRGGLNLGWSCSEGLEKFEGGDCAPGETYTEPVFTYSPYTGGCSVIGGHVYRGRQYADLVGGTYIATDYCSSTVWALRPDGSGGYEQAEIGEMPTQVTSIGTTVDGEFYVVNDLPGGLHRVSFQREEPTCRVDRTVRTWGTGTTVDLTVTNTGSAAVSGWTLAFPLALGQSVVSDWNTDLTQGSNTIAAANAPYNADIAPGASVSLGYLADHTGDASPPPRFTLNGDACAVGR
ncbi:PQQ-dependent sugar dehydrogenase [Streptomyces pristinaespiralis]|uniref:Glucose/sorbosone dehydrogenase-like protein n=1 Tax=Streptomyces pristinaespiralis TaxID=38300 RepID=A0A0M5IPM5_STRPR|nr:PQQ-dependent sugar dehydrogenase [Streptomyces pristinaespiralis]ALC24581.1 glucose/sorbosone dehydrogenase-like protein [Streptomyces pristinaespiralis]QMU13083.1 PQQ-dependent sugar dehydrogenase [Streptomyces pristinaespiralis]